MNEVLVLVVLGAVVLMLGTATYRLLRDDEARAEYAATVRAVRWWMVPAAVGHIVAVVATIALLLSALPALKYGWWILLGGTGNIALGQTGRSGELWQLVGFIVPLWLSTLVPHLARSEEVTFRYGSEDDSRGERLRRLTVFGLGHAVVMGVPIGAGVALIGSGMLYQLVYLRTFNRLLATTELVTVSSEPTRIDYPPMPEGAYDPAAWDAHHAEFTSVVAQNRVLLEEWFDGRKEQTQRRDEQIDKVCDVAVTKAAAFHAMSNWLILGLLIAWLTHSL